MNQAWEYMKEIEQAQEITNTMNHIRIHKKVYLVYELLDLKGQTPMKYYCDLREESYLEQKFPFQQVDKLREKVTKYWKEFIKLLKE